MLVEVCFEAFANMVNSHGSFLCILLLIVIVFLIKLKVIDYGIHAVINRMQLSRIKLYKR